MAHTTNVGVPEIAGFWEMVVIPSQFRAAAWATDPVSGVRYYVKTPKVSGQARVELLANSLYRALGIRVPLITLVTVQGRLSVASRIIPARASKMQLVAAHPEVQSGFIADAWLANWDMKSSNLLVDSDGHVWRLDQGGCLHRRALGEPKIFGPVVTEFHTLRDSVINPKAARLYGTIPQSSITAGISSVSSLSDDLIDSITRLAGFDSDTEGRLALVLKERREWLRSSLP